MKLQLVFLLTCCAAFAFDGHQVTEGDLTVLIEDPGPVIARNVTVPVRIALTNAGQGPLSGTVSLRRMIDDTHIVGRSECPFGVAGGERTHADFAVAFGEGTYSALTRSMRSSTSAKVSDATARTPSASS